jgi:hypothetical protein
MSIDKDDWRDANRDVTRGTLWGIKWSVFAVLGVIVVVLAGAFMWTGGFGLFSATTADFRGETEARERIHADGDYRIAIYNQFFDICASVQTAENRIEVYEQEMATATPERTFVLTTSISAIRAQRAESVNEYNSLAARDFTVADFQDLDLPARLDVDDEETQCAP